MQSTKSDQRWKLVFEESDNQLGLINTIRYLDSVNDELNREEIPGLILEIDLKELGMASSELIAQFFLLQQTLVVHDGHLEIVNVNPDLKSSFDVVMLDKIISVAYYGNVQYDDDEEE